MRLHSYEVSIPQGTERENGYVLMRHGTEFALKLRNHNHLRCNVEVTFQGLPQGAWRLEPYQTATLERPAHDTGKFTFYEVESEEGEGIGLDKVSKDDQGLVQVKFTPEQEVERTAYIPKGAKGMGASSRGQSLESFERSPYENTRGGGARGYSAGGIGLSGTSNQEYGQAKEMDVDESKAVTISLRLVAQKREGPRPLTSYPMSNPTPPPVG